MEKPKRTWKTGPAKRREIAHRLTVLLNEEERDGLFTYCDQEQITQAEAVRRGLKLLVRRSKPTTTDK